MSRPIVRPRMGYTLTLRSTTTLRDLTLAALQGNLEIHRVSFLLCNPVPPVVKGLPQLLGIPVTVFTLRAPPKLPQFVSEPGALLQSSANVSPPSTRRPRD